MMLANPSSRRLIRAAHCLIAFMVVGSSAITTSLVGASSSSASTPSSLPWVQQSPTTSPTIRDLASMAYDQATGQMVLFGGLGDVGVDGLQTVLGDTWTYDGATWTQRSPTTSPPVRYDASMAYDAATGQIVLFGGYSDNRGHTAGDTWTYDGTTWTQQSPATSPPARAGASMAYDSSTGQIVLFGGYNSEGLGDSHGLLNDTWTYDGTTWTEQSPATSPPTRYGASMAFDSSTDQVVLFGGSHDNLNYINDTWTYDGTTWTQQSPSTSPGARLNAALAYNPVSNQMVLMGGFEAGDSAPYGETWTYDGATWTQQSPTNSPPNEVGSSSMAYDPATNQVVLFGGKAWNDTWVYPGLSQAITFTSSAPSNPPQYAQPYTPTATSDSGLAVTLSLDASSSGCSFDGVSVTFTSSGTCIIDANQPGNDQYAPAPQIQQSINVAGHPYSPLSPARICDTRAGNPSHLTGPAAQCNGLTIPTAGSRTINVAGSFGVPADATAVVLNVTVVNPIGAGYLTAYPAGAAVPFASNIDYVRGQVVPNLVQVGMGAGGLVSFFASTQTDLVVDVEGYTSASAAGGTGAGLYNALSSPIRICDTRAGNPSGLSSPNSQCNGMSLATNGILPVKVANINGIPAGATAAVLNVTVVNPIAAGYLTVFPQGSSQPFASNLNYTTGQVTANRVIVPLSTNGATPGYISVYSTSAADVVVDVSGYYSMAGGSGTTFTAEADPVRICDTRAGNPSNLTGPASQCNGDTMTQGGAVTLMVAGLAGVPADAKSVVVNLTGIAPTQLTFLTVFPGPGIPGWSIPGTSDLNPAAGEVRANMVVATINPQYGWISVVNGTGSIDIAVDVLGWYS